MSDLLLNVKDGVASQAKTNESTLVPKNNLGKDAFLQLLVCQMKYQDPLEPQADTAFVAQLATFSQLEQLQNLNTTNSHAQAFNLVDKSVIVKTTESSGNIKYVSGVVNSATVQSGVAYIEVNKQLYPISQLESVISSTKNEEKPVEEEKPV